jgi:hypothetical protein
MMRVAIWATFGMFAYLFLTFILSETPVRFLLEVIGWYH